MRSRNERSHLMLAVAPGCSGHLSLAAASCSPCVAMAAEDRVLGEVDGETLYARTGSARGLGKDSKGQDMRKCLRSLMWSPKGRPCFRSH